MKKSVSLPFIVLLLSITSFAQDKIEISLKNSSREESQTRDQLQRLLKRYTSSSLLMLRIAFTKPRFKTLGRPFLNRPFYRVSKVSLLPCRRKCLRSAHVSTKD
jgi:hypothetical protein